MAAHLSATSPDGSVYERVAARMIEALSRGVAPWRKPWTDPAPRNAVTERLYRGINLLLLSMSGYRDHRWLTFRQALDLGGAVRKGEKSSLVVFWKLWDRETEDEASGEVRRREIPVLRHHPVFNVEQCDRLDLPAVDRPLPAGEERHRAAETVVASMPDPPAIRFGADRAWYRPPSDLVGIPHEEAFESLDARYATLYHELAHATGHERRLNRPAVTRRAEFGSCDYGREELVAELASAFLCAAVGLDNSLQDNAAAYVGSWLEAIREDPRAVVVASGQAQRAADRILGVPDAR
ncbi:MAG: DUF1738 domain-containing protein [Fimbriimonadaceae bacterium]|nr:DUF1738 domain-containing protein [Fimbriimonadaceae bacterium]